MANTAADAYVRSLLVDGESIRAEAKQHWFALIRYAFRPILILIAALVCFAIGVWLNPTGNGFIDQIVRWIDTLLGLVTLALVVWAIVWLPVQAYRWIRRRFIVTDRRVLYVVGAWRRQATDIGLNMITDVGFQQSVLGRQLGYGELKISTASNRGLTFTQIRKALEFRKAIMDAQRATIEARADEIMVSKGQLPASGAVGAGAPIATAGAVAAAVAAPAAAPEPETVPAWDGSDVPQMLEDDVPPPLPGAYVAPATEVEAADTSEAATAATETATESAPSVVAAAPAPSVAEPVAEPQPAVSKLETEPEPVASVPASEEAAAPEPAVEALASTASEAAATDEPVAAPPETPATDEPVAAPPETPATDEPVAAPPETPAAGGHIAALGEVDSSMAGVADGAKGSGAESVTAAIARLADLRDSGAITAEEFETRKQELLDRL